MHVMISGSIGLAGAALAASAMFGGTNGGVGAIGTLVSLGAVYALGLARGGARSTVSSASSETQAGPAQSNAHLSTALLAAETAQMGKREFMANMSHELRTPMTAILGYADLLTSPDISASDRAEFVQNIRRSGRHLLSIINDILDISRVESGQLEVEMAPISPVQIFEEVLSLARPQSVGKGLELSSVVELPMPAKIRTDAARVRQILLNLLGNAIKFTEQGSVSLRIEFVGGDAPAVRYEVADTGPGIEPARLAALFEPFTQIDASSSRRHGGLGVGLALASRLAGLIGASLEGRSEPGKGTTFTLTVPTGPLEGVVLRDRLRAGDSGHTISLAERLEAPIGSSPLRGRRILFVEDGPDNRRLVCFHLKLAGATVETAENGRIGHDAAMAAAGMGTPFDLVFMDMQMPEMDGYAATSLLRSEGYRSPIVALTAHAMNGDREKCIAAGCDDYITKPIDRDILLRTASRWVGGAGLDGTNPMAVAAAA